MTYQRNYVQEELWGKGITFAQSNDNYPDGKGGLCWNCGTFTAGKVSKVWRCTHCQFIHRNFETGDAVTWTSVAGRNPVSYKLRQGHISFMLDGQAVVQIKGSAITLPLHRLRFKDETSQLSEIVELIREGQR